MHSYEQHKHVHHHSPQKWQIHPELSESMCHIAWGAAAVFLSLSFSLSLWSFDWFPGSAAEEF